MVKTSIEKDELQALDIVLDKIEVKPIIGYKIISFRLRVRQAIEKEAKRIANEKNNTDTKT